MLKAEAEAEAEVVGKETEEGEEAKVNKNKDNLNCKSFGHLSRKNDSLINVKLFCTRFKMMSVCVLSGQVVVKIMTLILYF